MTKPPASHRRSVAFVLGGGGALGGYEAGMLRALFEHGIQPDMIVGTSVGSIHGAVAAANPTVDSFDSLTALWGEFLSKHVMHVSGAASVASLAHHHPYLASNEALRELLVGMFGSDKQIEDLPVRFECVAACIESASATYFSRGPLLPALLASCAIPGLWPAVEIDGKHYYDGGVVDSIPVRRALELGAQTVYILQVGRIERKLNPPRHIWEVATVAFEIARRHGFADAVGAVPEHIAVHVLPTGEDSTAPHHHKAFFETEHHKLDDIMHRIESGYQATREYLAKQPALPLRGQ